MRCYIGVACKEHVENGVKLGICQFCHGKVAPAKRLKQHDYIIYYSSKVTMTCAKLYQKFTAVGRITDDEIYSYDMGNGFMVYRRNVEYLDIKSHVEIQPLIEELSFIKNKASWGGVFRYGFLEIDQKSFDNIAAKMLDKNVYDGIMR